MLNSHDFEQAQRTGTRSLDLLQNPGPDPLEILQGAPSMVAVTTAISRYPTTPQVFYAMLPLALAGTESEGSSGITTTSSTVFFALNLGSTVPAPGTQHVVTFVGSRWVFRHDG